MKNLNTIFQTTIFNAKRKKGAQAINVERLMEQLDDCTSFRIFEIQPNQETEAQKPEITYIMIEIKNN